MRRSVHWGAFHELHSYTTFKQGWPTLKMEWNEDWKHWCVSTPCQLVDNIFRLFLGGRRVALGTYWCHSRLDLHSSICLFQSLCCLNSLHLLWCFSSSNSASWDHVMFLVRDAAVSIQGKHMPFVLCMWCRSPWLSLEQWRDQVPLDIGSEGNLMEGSFLLKFCSCFSTETRL